MVEFDRVPKRKLSNYLLKPLQKSKIGMYFIILSSLFSLSIGWIIYQNFSDLFYTILELTDASKEIQDILERYWTSVQSWIWLVVIIYLSLTVVLSIWYTHRFVGPTVAFLRHLEEINKGNYVFRTVLRRGDAFEELAKALNQASAALEIQKKAENIDFESDKLKTPKDEE